MSSPGLISAVLAAIGMWLALPGPASLPMGAASSRSLLIPLSLASALMIGFTIGGTAGLLVGIGVCIATPKIISTAVARRSEHERHQLERDLPAAASLLAALLASGATIQASLSALAGAHRGPLRPALLRVDAAMKLGASPEEAWAAGSDALAPIAMALRRSARSGAPAASILADVVTDAQRTWRSRAEIAARSAGVRAVLPLIACFLPAFFLVGVVPVIASVAGSVLR